MKPHLLLLWVLAAGMIACQPTAPAGGAVPPFVAATATRQIPTLAAPSPTTAPTPAPSTTAPRATTGLAVATTPAKATASSLHATVDPAEQTVPAGASTTFFIGAAGWSSSLPAPRWSVAGLPAGARSEFIPDAFPANSTLVVDTPCSLSRGAYPLDVQATISQTTQSAKPKLTIADRLVESVPGSFTGSFTANTITVRRGGPSTVRSGPFLILKFCESTAPRKGTVRVQSATSDAGTPLKEPPRFGLFKSLAWPVPDSLQTVGGGYRANARDVAFSDGSTLQWNITNGVYVLAFLRSPFEESKPAAERPASVTYNLEIVR